MPYRSLRDFIAKLESAGELVRVREPVSTVLEMTEIQTRLIAEVGPAVLFEKAVRGALPECKAPRAEERMGRMGRPPSDAAGTKVWNNTMKIPRRMKCFIFGSFSVANNINNY